jgi:hypothetical protein
MTDIEQEVAEEPDEVVLVEFPTTPGLREVALTPAELLEKSSAALDSAAGAIRGMARKFGDQLTTLPVRPREAELEFGVKLTAEAGAFVAKAGGEGTIVVRLKWAPGEM